MGALKLLPEGHEALLSIGWGAGVGVFDRLTLASCCPLLETVDDEGKEKGHGKDGDNEVYDQPEIHGDTSSQALNPDEQALPKPGGALAGIEALEISASSRGVEEPGAEFLPGLRRWISRAPERPEPCPWAGTGRVQQQLAKRSSYHGAGKGRAARDASRLYGAGDVL